jgi:Sec7-like guanine-nucleotide exchange factor
VTLYLRSGESFYTNALKAYIDRFEFDSDPLDVALRKLLMDVGLPRETQQIDRVMEAFASRYLICNRSLFTSDGMFSFLLETCRKAHRRKIIPISLPLA